MEIQPNLAQQKALQALDEQRNGKSLVVLPSGIGKTYLAAFDTLRMNPKRILYLVHRNEILDQASRVFMEIHGLNENQIGFINQYTKQYDKKIVFSTIQTFSRPKNFKKINPKFYDYVILDEYHHVAAKTYKRILKYLQPKFLLGLTATPFRLDGKDIFEFVDNNVAFEMKLKEGIETKLLVPFIYYGFWDNIDYSDIEWQGYRYLEKDLNKKLLIKKRDEQIIREFKKFVRKKQTIGFCVSVRHVKRMVKLFNSENIPSAEISYKIPYLARRKIIEDFRNKKYQILFTKDIFNEGVDFPEVQALLFLRPTFSKTVFLQQLGRGLRTSEDKRNVLVLDFIGNYVNAYKLKEWISIFSKGLNVRPPKPTYNYSVSQVWFENKVIELFEMQEERIITKEKLIEDYLRIKKQLVKIPSALDMAKHGKHSIGSYVSRWGSWLNFKKFMKDNRTSYEKEQIIENLKSFYEKYKKIPLARDCKRYKKELITDNTVRKLFGSWENALIASGFELPQWYINKQKINKIKTKKDMIKIFNDTKKSLKRIPTVNEMDKFAGFSFNSLLKRKFKISYIDVLHSLGITTKQTRIKYKISLEQIKKEMKELSKKTKIPPKFKDLPSHIKYYFQTHKAKYTDFLNLWKSKKKLYNR